jgi:protein-L-isoaspartate(D-aspartate) O-methyltransferase
MHLSDRRRFYAEEVQMVANLKSAALVDALATVERERYLPPGPWTVRSEADLGQAPRQTVDANPCRVYHNISIAIDAPRMLFNGNPALLSMAIDSLNVSAGSRVLHIGTGTGYYTALMAHVAGPSGQVVGIEVDASLAEKARTNLAPLRQVEIRHGNGVGSLSGTFDGILVNAGVTHPLDTWLDALAEGGRIVLPLTATMAAVAPIGKGLLLLVTREGSAFTVRTLTFVAIYSAVGVRDDALNAEIGKALQKHPFPPLAALTRATHERTDACWLHTDQFCLSTRVAAT